MMQDQPNIEALIRFEKTRRRRMLDYLELKVEEQDWHGVQDAASDLRDLDERIKAFKEILNG
jgi:hypothetical protein